MPEIIGVRFKDGGKMYYFDPAGMKIEKGKKVIVETVQGVECGTCTIANTILPEDPEHPLKKVLRIANAEDEKKIAENRAKEKEAYGICQEKINKHGLDMKLIDVEYTFDGSKILFYFTSDGRVDFRELVKDLAGVFRTRIELRQVGVRDEARLLGGLGICGRAFCCGGFLKDFEPVSIKMAKEQNLSLNPTKISGTCGRLMCCLKYEQSTYEYLNKISPRIGAIVNTPKGKGTVEDINILTGKVKVKLEDASEISAETFNREELKILVDGKGSAGKALPEASEE
ncbi:MAG: stage 0 sporulation family protein [Clostridia bacterium]|nr:stage 0 sporulation family protein [Clostridia bacterium]